MSLWAQVVNDRVTTIPPGPILDQDGKPVTVDFYAEFSFCDPRTGQAPFPLGTHIGFVVGIGQLPEVTRTLADITEAIQPVQGVSFIDAKISPPTGSDGKGIGIGGISEDLFVRAGNDDIVQRRVARASLLPVPAEQAGNTLTVVAYSTYDALGTVKNRLAVASANITVSKGQGTFLATTERYDPVGNAWATKAPMPTARAGPFCGEVGGKAYIIGGHNGEFLTVCEEYNPVLNSWATKEPMPTARGFGCSVSLGSDIYCIGGYNYGSGRASAAVEKYTPGSDAWSLLSPLPIPLAFATAQAIGTDIYVFYGASQFDEREQPTRGNSCFLKYDTVTDSWEAVTTSWGGAPATTLSANVPIGSLVLPFSTATAFADFGAVTIGVGAGAETLLYSSVSSAEDKKIVLLEATVKIHSLGDSLVQTSLPRQRFSPNSYYDGVRVYILNGYDPVTQKPNGEIEGFDPISGIVTSPVAPPSPLVFPSLPRFSASQALVTTTLCLACGSGIESDFLDQVETVDTVTGAFSGPGGLAKAPTVRTNAGSCAIGSYAYVFGGQGNGHENGWLRLKVETSPASVLADGKQSGSVSVTATLPDGDPAPDEINLKVRGLLFVQATPPSGTVAVAQSTISILPVLFSSETMTLLNGEAATIALPRAEDPINEVQNLSDFVKANEEVVNQRDLQSPPKSLSELDIKFGEDRTLYGIAIEISVDDAVYSGTTDTAGTVSGQSESPLSSGTFSFDPAASSQGLSGRLEFHSNIASIPDVQFVSQDPVPAATATTSLDALQEEQPFGASPLYDAIVLGAQARNDATLGLLPPSNMMAAASDNENNGSASSAQEATDELNSVEGDMQFPAFITTFVVTSPISLAARKERTDVADLELISSETGGNSFTVEDSSYIPFVIGRIMASAPSSMGSGYIEVTHDADGYLYGFSFTVSNMISGNSAVMTVQYSEDGYNWTDLGIPLAADQQSYPNVDETATYVLAVPVKAIKVRYRISFSSQSFQSPILKSAIVKFIGPNVQYLFTYPQTVGGQVSELAAVTNERLPAGGKIDAGLSHGASLEFERDYAPAQQPSVSGRGTIKAISRAVSPILDGVVFREKMTTEDQLLYSAPSGPWAQDATWTVFINGQEASESTFVSIPEESRIAFRKRLATDDSVEIEIQDPPSFRVALKATNPSLLRGVLDSFAFMWGETSREAGLKPNRPPRALNLFITPSPAMPGGPLTANYTFFDPDGDDEDLSKTQLTWFRNGTPIPCLTNLRTVTNSDIFAGRSDGIMGIAKEQKWFFTVRPSDSKSFGPLATSATFTIANRPPTATSAYLRSSNKIDPSIFNSSDSVTASFTYGDLDGDSQKGSLFSWLANGVEVKSGTASVLTPDDKDPTGAKILSPGKSISATVVPFDNTDYGTSITTNVIVVVPTPPTLENVSITPTAPTANTPLVLTYQLVSVDGLPDQSTVAWFKNGTKQSAYDNQRTIGVVGQGVGAILVPGDNWYADVTPDNQGATVRSNAVRIQQ